LANWQKKILTSYINAPAVHAAALKNPAMRSGPFMAVDISQLPLVRNVLDRTLREEDRLFRFAEAVRTLNELLASEGRGFSLEGLYAKTPDELKGLVELVYDLNNQASIRFLEGLLYNSCYYRKASQVLAFSIPESDDRPFLFSTPRLPADGQFRLSIPFDDPRIDDLFRLRTSPQPLSQIRELLGKPGPERVAPSLFTEEAPPPRPTFDGPGVRVRYLGHACVLIEARGISVITDPIVCDRAEGPVSRYHYANLPSRIDYVLVTHAHPDHVCIETLLQLRHKIGCVVVPRCGGGSLEDPSLKLLLRKLGFARVIELDELERLEVEGGEIVGVPFLGEHGDLNIRSKIAHLVRLNGVGVLCVADSCNLENRIYERVREVTGDIDTLFLGMECEGAPISWLYGAFQTHPLERKMDQSRRLAGSNCSRGLDMIARLGSKRVYVYAMGLEPWMRFITGLDGEGDSLSVRESDLLIARCRERGIPAERLFGREEILL
jgi:L-ascorbate metabolism protein UlaG (beta-lactamase superfamily)